VQTHATNNVVLSNIFFLSNFLRKKI